MTFIIAAWLDLAERYVDWTAMGERYQLDELIFVMLVLSMGLIWFSIRRLHELRLTLLRNQAMQAELQNSNAHVNALLKQNRELIKRMTLVRESERELLATELHDVFGQHLAAMDANVSAAINGSPAESGVLPALRSTQDSIEYLRTVTRDKLRKLKPPTLDSLGLTDSIKALIDHWLASFPRHRVQHRLDIDEAGLDEEVALTVYRCLQEGLVNISRHAEASEVCISARTLRARHGCALHLLLEDNGQGLDPITSMGKGLGLLGMRERTHALGGHFALSRVTPHGTRIELFIPCHPTS